jgi:microcystin-dependent protein
MNAPDATALGAMADDVATVAAECATQRLGLLDGLVDKLPNDALAAMAAVTETLSDAVGSLNNDGFLVGDIRFTGRHEPAEGWVFLLGQSVGNADSGADLAGGDYEELFELARTWAPNNGAEDFAGGDLVLLPDMRGRVPAGPDAMGGSAANRLTNPAGSQIGGTLGAESHQLTIAQMPSHSHGMSTAGNHKHSYTDVSTVSGSSLGSGGNRGDSSVTRNTATAGAHKHTIYSTGGSQSHPIVQPTIIFSVEMKVQ